MAQVFRDKVLKDLLKKIESDKVVRKLLEGMPTQVTYSREGVINGVQEGYAKIQKKLGDRYYELSDAEWNEVADAVLGYVEEWARRERTTGTLDEAQTDYNQVVYSAKTDVKEVHKEAKKKAIKALNDIRERNSKDALQGGGQAAGDAFKAGNIDEGKRLVRESEIGTINRSSHKLHKGATTVGAARIGAAMAHLERGAFGGFARLQKHKKMSEVLGAIEVVWDIKIDPKTGQAIISLNEGQTISLEIDADSENPAGGEEYDFNKLKPILAEALFKYIVENKIGKGKDWTDIKGSPSITENAVEQLEYAIVEELISVDNVSLKKGKNTKPKGRKSSNTSRKNPGTTLKAQRSNKKASPGLKQMRKTKAKRSNASLLSILALVNQKLPQVVAENMGSPRLRYQSGRFAASTRAVDVNVTAQGFPSIGYTYQKNPYQTFEPGYAYGSEDRDPRRLIDTSIREIMAGMAIGRFYTRRL